MVSNDAVPGKEFNMRDRRAFAKSIEAVSVLYCLQASGKPVGRDRVTFSKTLVSNYQIIFPVPNLACSLVPQSSEYKAVTDLACLLCTFLPNLGSSTPDSRLT